MAIRRPPDDFIPPVVRGGRIPPPRVVRYVEEAPPGFFRSLLRFLLRPYIVIPAVLVTAVVISVLVYYWIIFSARIYNLLKGEVFTRSAGIYAAPKQIRSGQNISEDELTAYLKRTGYVERGQQAESARGRYSANGLTVEIEPGTDTTVDNARAFESLRIQFAHGGKSIASISNRDNGAREERAELEPELISSV